MTADLLPWIISAVSLVGLLAVVVSMSRTQREIRAVHEDSMATKREQIATLEAQVASLRETESVRFVERYLAAKNGLQERQDRLHERLEAVRDDQTDLESELADLTLSDEEREREGQRLRQDLIQATDQVQRLETVLREVASLGDMDVKALRTALMERRDLSAHIKERLDRLSLEHRDRTASRQIRESKLERLEAEGARLRREVEITRAAAAMVDAIMGIDRDTRRRLARHASDRIEGAIQSLGDMSARNPVSWFVDILDEQRPDRLLEGGDREPGPMGGDEPSGDRGSVPDPEDRDTAASSGTGARDGHAATTGH